MKKVMTDAQRRKKADDKQRALGRVGRKKWLTKSEHEKIDAIIKQGREIGGKQTKTEIPDGVSQVVNAVSGEAVMCKAIKRKVTYD